MLWVLEINLDLLSFSPISSEFFVVVVLIYLHSLSHSLQNAYNNVVFTELIMIRNYMTSSVYSINGIYFIVNIKTLKTLWDLPPKTLLFDI